MSAKILGAAATVALFSATVPFYVSGHFSHKALNDQLQMISNAKSDVFTIENIQSNLGLYQSDFNYDMVFNLQGPDLAKLKAWIGGDTLRLTVNNKASHGFMNVEVDTTFAGEGKTLMDGLLKDLNLALDNKDAPMMSLVSNASISLTGQYEMTTIADFQGFSIGSVNEYGDQEMIKLSPFVSSATLNGEQVSGTTDIAEMVLQTGDTQFVLTDLSMSGDGELNRQAAHKFNLFGSQNFVLKLAELTLKGPAQQVQAGKDLNWRFNSHFADNRAYLDSHLTLAEAGLPKIPQSQVSDVEIDFSAHGGEQAVKDYYQAIDQLQQDNGDPQQAFNVIAKLVAEDLNIKLNTVKANTFTGPVDLTANLDVAAVEPEQLQVNPMLLLQSLSYSAKGEIPKALLLMTGQIPPEVIDNLVQNDMLALENDQLKFDMQGEKGAVTLNGKPLM